MICVSQVFKSDADLEDDAVEERAVMLLSGGTWVMSPDCAFRRRWDVLQAIILLYISIMVPIRVGFKVSRLQTVSEVGWAEVGVSESSVHKHCVDEVELI